MALGLLLGVGLLSGSYPAFYLSGFLPSRVLKGLHGNSRLGAVGIRKGLVVFQFALSSGLIIGTAIIFNQMNFIKNKKLGFEKEQLVLITIRDEDDQIHVERLREELIQLPRILGASASSGSTGKGRFSRLPGYTQKRQNR